MSSLRRIVRATVPLSLRQVVYRARYPKQPKPEQLEPKRKRRSKRNREDSNVSKLPTAKDFASLARSNREHWQLAEALEHARELVRLFPGYAPGMPLLASILVDLHQIDEAQALCERLIERDPLNLDALALLSSIGRPVPRSIEVADQWLRTHAVTVENYNTALKYLIDSSLCVHALAVAEFASQIAREHPDPHKLDLITLQKAKAYMSLGRYNEAIDILVTVKSDGARRIAIDDIAACYLELGKPYRAMAAIGHQIIWADAQYPFSKSMIPCLYATDDIKNAHLLYRRRAGSLVIASVFNMPSTDEMEILSGRYARQDALIFAEGGPGDEIRMAAVYDELRPLFGKLRITCDPRLLMLLERSFPDIEFIPVARHRNERRENSLADRGSIPSRKLWTFVNDQSLEAAQRSGFVASNLDMLGELRATRKDFARSPSRLKAAPYQGAISTPAGIKRVGLTWRGFLRSSVRDIHYLDIAELAPLARLKNVEFWLLQSKLTDDERVQIRNLLPNVHEFPDLDLVDDLDGLASAMSTLDLVVSPGTSIVEQAGMLDVPTIFLSTSAQTYWRKNPDGSDVWYPAKGKVVSTFPKRDNIALMEQVAHIIERSSTKAGRKLP